MKKLLVPFLLLLLFLSACGNTSEATDDVESSDTLNITTTSYPIYLFASEIANGAEGVVVTPLVNQDISCLHDYTLTVNDMITLENSDIIIMNGADLDEFMLDGLAGIPKEFSIIDAGMNVDYLCGDDCDEDHDHDHDDEAEVVEDDHDHDDEAEVAEEDHDHDHDDEDASTEEEHDHDHDDEDASTEEEHDHDHDYENDPHYWMSPITAATMVETIAAELAILDPANADIYTANAAAAVEKLLAAQEDFSTQLESLSARDLITFHDGFAYFAAAFDLDLLVSIEEEEGQEASAMVIAEIITIIGEHKVPTIFTEDYSSDSTAKAIASETGVNILCLSMMMSGEAENAGIDTYIEIMQNNINVIIEGLS